MLFRNEICKKYIKLLHINIEQKFKWIKNLKYYYYHFQISYWFLFNGEKPEPLKDLSAIF